MNLEHFIDNHLESDSMDIVIRKKSGVKLKDPNYHNYQVTSAPTRKR